MNMNRLFHQYHDPRTFVLTRHHSNEKQMIHMALYRPHKMFMSIQERLVLELKLDQINNIMTKRTQEPQSMSYEDRVKLATELDIDDPGEINLFAAQQAHTRWWREYAKKYLPKRYT